MTNYQFFKVHPSRTNMRTTPIRWHVDFAERYGTASASAKGTFHTRKKE